MDIEFKKKVDEFIDKSLAKVKTLEEGLDASQKKTDAELAKIRTDFQADMEKYYDRVRERNVSLPGSELPDGKKKFSWSRAINGIINRDWEGAEHEKKIFDETRKLVTRAGDNTMTGANMGFFVPTEVAKEVLMPAQAAMVMPVLGATMYNDLRGELPFPEITDEPVLSWSPENRAASATKVSAGRKVMRPKTGKMLIKMSNKLNYQTSGTAEQIILEQMRKGTARGMDKICIVGKGADSEPLGILNAPGISSSKVAVGTNGGRFTIDNAARLMAEIEDRNYQATGLLSFPRVINGMKRERVEQFSGQGSTKGQPIMINPLMTDEVLSGLLGLKIAKTTNIPKTGTKGTATACAKVIAGDWSEFKVGNWGGIQLKTSQEAGESFANDELWIAVFVDLDTLVAHADAFEICPDADTDESHW